MEILQFLLIWTLFLVVVYLIRINNFNKKATEETNYNTEKMFNDVFENIKDLHKRLDHLFNSIDIQVTSNEDFKTELMDKFEDMKSYVNNFPIVWEKNLLNTGKIIENYAVANDMEIAKIMDKVNSIESEQVELNHSFEVMLSSLAEVKTAEFLDNLGSQHDID
jgi:hypothetical protein